MSESERYDEGGNRLRLAKLQDLGVEVWGAERVYISEETPLENIEPGAALYNATIVGESTRIGKGSRIGRAGHARVEDCQIGRNVELGAGVYEGATILDETKIRGFAELRPGTLLEEECEAAHTVAFKNTILTAACVTGSVINLCDLFMSGGTSRQDHSEVGSGVIHFNFDPRGDKWGSLLGDVRGVLLRSAPVFVGGQAGLVGPLHVDFGGVVAAGSVVRKDVGPDRVYYEAGRTQTIEGFNRYIYTSLRRKFLTTAKLIGTLHALTAWYDQVRLPYADERLRPLYESAKKQAAVHIAERVKRLRRIIGKLERSITETTKSGDSGLLQLRAAHRCILENEDAIVDLLSGLLAEDPCPGSFLSEYERLRGEHPHIQAVGRVSDRVGAEAESWLGRLAHKPLYELAGILGES